MTWVWIFVKNGHHLIGFAKINLKSDFVTEFVLRTFQSFSVAVFLNNIWLLLIFIVIEFIIIEYRNHMKIKQLPLFL